MLRLKKNLIQISDYQMQSLHIMRELEQFLNHSDKNNEEIKNKLGCDKIFLGWMSKKWIPSTNKNANKWYSVVIKSCVQHMIESWEERNEEIHSEEKRKENLIQRTEEIRMKKDCSKQFEDLLNETKKEKEKMTCRQLAIRLERIREEAKKEKKRSKERSGDETTDIRKFFEE